MSGKSKKILMFTPLQKRWTIKIPDQAQVDRLAAEAALSPLVARLLVNRGITDADEARRFLSPSLADLHDPFTMLGMHQAAERLARAVCERERICIYGDYDVDGITAVALLTDFLRRLGGDCIYYIPLRLEDGYGMNEGAVREIAAQGARLVVTVDCGVTAVREAECCRELGIDLVITDHHLPGEVLPQAYALLDPQQPGCPFPSKQVAGVGVAFNLITALRRTLRERGWFAGREEPRLKEYLDLVALGTIADVAPLTGDNRIYARYGLMELSLGKRCGIAALKRVAGIDGPVGCGAVGFRLAPRLNACGRLEDARQGVELLLTEDPAVAAEIAGRLNDCNAERQAVEQRILQEAIAMVTAGGGVVGRCSIVLGSCDWHPGVIGIVASRLVDLFHRPTILIALEDGIGKGSGRSIPGFHLFEALHACAGRLLKFGGHRHAAGLSLEESSLECFAREFDVVASNNLTNEQFIIYLTIDMELPAEGLDESLGEVHELLAPFGVGNPEPVFALRNVRIIKKSILKERHLKLQLVSSGRTIEAIGFDMADVEIGERMDIVFTPEINCWNGRKRLQLRLRDCAAPAESMPHESPPSA